VTQLLEGQEHVGDLSGSGCCGHDGAADRVVDHARAQIEHFAQCKVRGPTRANSSIGASKRVPSSATKK
jgi:hypothetical protein